MAAKKLKMLVDVKSGKVDQVVQDFKDEGYAIVKKQKQASGAWSVAAAK